MSTMNIMDSTFSSLFSGLFGGLSFSSLAASVPQTFSALGFALQNIALRDIVDIAVVSIAFYLVLLFIKQTKSYFLTSVLIVVVVIGTLSQNLDLTLTRTILQPLSTLTFIIIAIVFQREIRRFFKWIVTGQSHIFSFSGSKQISKGASGEIAEALLEMAKQRIGGIIVFTGKQELDDMVEGGQYLGGKITKEIILSIFDTNSAGHDGAIIVENDFVKQFGVHLPLAREFSDYKKVGTRHRASAGITEDTDSVALTVSEERGTISVFRDGKSKVIQDEEELRDLLRVLSGETEDEQTNFWKYFFFNNLGSKAVAVSIALVLWLLLFVQSGVTRKEYIVPISFQLIPATLEVDTASYVREIHVVLEGRTRDINVIDPSRLEAKIDAKDFKAGYQRVEINRAMINVPTYVNVITIDPKSLSIHVLEKSAE